MFSEALKDPKTLTSAGAIIIALALIWLINENNKTNSENLAISNEVIRANTAALSKNTAVVEQFQSLLIQISKDKGARNSLLNALTIDEKVN